MTSFPANTRNSGALRARMSGFTVVEVITSIAVVAILSAMAVPAMGGFVRDSRVRDASFEMRAVLMRARSEAINRNKEVEVIPDTGEWSNGWTLQTTDGELIEQFTGLDNVSVSPSPAPTVVYRVDGRVRAGSQMIVISDQGTGSKTHPRCISLRPSGLAATRIDGNYDPDDGCI